MNYGGGRYGEHGSSSGGTTGSSARLSSSIIDFGEEQNYVAKTVLDSAITSKSVVSVIVDNIDLALQCVSFHAENIVAGIGYDLVGIAPYGASGNYTISILITEV